MNRKIFFPILTALCIGVFAFQVSAQKLQNGGKPKSATKVAGLIEAACVKFAPDVQICKGKPSDEEYGVGKFIVRRGGRQIAEFSGSLNAFGGVTDDFQALYGDFDNNQSKELVVVDFEGQGQGLGVKNYTINIFPDFETSKTFVPLTFADAEFGAGSSFIYDAKTKETLILLTGWGGVEVKDPKRGDGLYFTGRFLRYKNGKVMPAADKPILARRYLNSFERERFRTETDSRVPYLWLQSADTLKLKTDPAFDKKFASSESGTVERVETIAETTGEGDDRREIKVTQMIVRLDSGAKKTVVLLKSPIYGDVPSDADKIFPINFGFMPQKILLPSGFNPFNSVDNVENRRVQINLEKPDAESPPNYYVWFVEK
ncbi:MAG: hypothetical protein LH614_09310 [Pyrinomonadaceae bacterium]|nr:hypothetical protein [Pyrinomonadaceae bacterium]